MLDVLIGRPLDEILDTINVLNDIRVALTTGANRYGDLLSLALAYERAEWREVDQGRTSWVWKRRPSLPHTEGLYNGWSRYLMPGPPRAGWSKFG